ncbi:ComF family protein [Geomicrobium sp. JCM 19039]|uniref:ComF family protein n=1 Tax=Geomicrobium sp. JCM 19039 TaxID=1460636 RepID=UPI00045F324D|nr:double zinc ribbon domain-containing protein [Geomicrobium sp. JCM 19039]GAK11631.1 competence protein F homolog, phosphoribosyltransferase domain [Geomicrobium sp. JCM 19039]
MIACAYCGKVDSPLPSWATFFVVNDNNLCGRCAEHLEKLESPWCEVCSRPMKENGICSDCNRWESSAKWAGLIQRNRSVFQYNEWMQGYLAQLKYRGDAALADVFARNLQRIYRQQFDRCLLVPIPLSEQRMSERGSIRVRL